MKFCIGIAIISVAVVVLLAASLYFEYRSKQYWFDKWSEISKENWRLRRILEEIQKQER